ncbi:AlpA family phage regulatory protein [Psychrobacter sp. Ps4]|nr:AlpA family phage regulatory protein [Psychrobacter sp. Ps4]
MLSFTYKEQIMENLNASTQQNVSTLSMPQIPRMLPLKQVIHYTGLSSTTIYDMLDKRSHRYDPTFPVQVKLSKGRVAWVESEISQWIESKIAARFH